jgi:hypothetical protein
MMKKWIFIAFSCAVLVFCRITPVSASAMYQYQKARELPDAKQYILDALAQNKLVFVGEDHTQINEELFMAENMQAFYDAGLRYIFVEENEDYEPLQAPLVIFPPWRDDVGRGDGGGGIGGKYEGDDVVGHAIQTINDAVPEAERIQFIPTEAGYNPTPEEGNLDKRDQQAFKNISAFMEKLPPHKKVMIFYGSAHGITKPIEWSVDGGEPFLWTPIGAYLKEQYGDNFISIVFTSLKDERLSRSWDIPELRDSGSKPKILLSNSKHDVVNNDQIHSDLSRYDAVLLDREVLYGIGNNYNPTYKYLVAMYNNLRNLENSIDTWKDDVATFRFQEQGQYLQLIYCLKLWLGDSFDYRLWDTKKSLREALDDLGASNIQEIALILNAQDAQNTQRMYDYTKVMLLSALTNFIYDGYGFAYPLEEIYDDVLLFIADHMKEAIAIFPQDLWPYYWLAYAETELGDYDAAIAHWEYIIAQPLSYCLETLPRVYQKLSVCYAATGDQAKSDEYKKIGESLLNEHHLIVTNLNDVK